MGILYIVATPIGNYQDITLRAIEVLNTVDAVICEDIRQASTLLKKIGVGSKELVILNEHNEQGSAADIAIRLSRGANMALISDAGTPVFSDPGHHLINQVSGLGIRVVPVPGPSSLMAALSVLDFKIEKFIYRNFLPRDPEQRRRELNQLRSVRYPIVIMDTPYRLAPLLDDILKVFGKGQPVTLVCDISLDRETIFRGSVQDVARQVGKRKAEFVLIIH